MLEVEEEASCTVLLVAEELSTAFLFAPLVTAERGCMRQFDIELPSYFEPRACLLYSNARVLHSVVITIRQTICRHANTRTYTVLCMDLYCSSSPSYIEKKPKSYQTIGERRFFSFSPFSSCGVHH